jgi:hypothetical protein
VMHRFSLALTSSSLCFLDKSKDAKLDHWLGRPRSEDFTDIPARDCWPSDNTLPDKLPFHNRNVRPQNIFQVHRPICEHVTHSWS